MSPHQWRSWKQFFRQNIGSKRRAERRRLIVEQLECRLAPAIVANDDSYVMVQDTALHLPGGQQFLAQAGFNDAKGINSNPFPDSPYRLGDTIHRRGIKEPGWAAGWVRQVPRCGGLRHAQNLHQVPHAHLSSLEQTQDAEPSPVGESPKHAVNTVDAGSFFHIRLREYTRARSFCPGGDRRNGEPESSY